MQIKETTDFFGTYVFTCTTDREDCPVDTGVVLKSFQIIVVFEGAIMKFVIHITYLLGFEFFFLSFFFFYGFGHFKFFVLNFNMVLIKAKMLMDTSVHTNNSSNSPGDSPRERKCIRLQVVPLH